MARRADHSAGLRDDGGARRRARHQSSALFVRTAWCATDEIIDAATVVIVGATDTTDLVIDSVGHTDTVVTAWLSGGEPGEHYSLTCHITTNQARQDDRTIKLTIKQR